MTAGMDLIEVALRLRAIARDDGSIDAAQVKLIGLDEIRLAAGPRWPHLRERVRTGSMDILARHAHAGDVVIPAGDGFLIVLAEGAPGQNQARCQKMREALLAFYLGEDALKTIQPKVTARSLSADGLADLLATGLERDRDVGAQPQTVGSDRIVEAPIFSTRSDSVVGTLICPVRTERGARRVAYNGDFILDGRHQRTSAFVDLDIALARHAAGVRPAGGAAVGFSVHASTMQQRRTREAYLGALARLDRSFRQRAFISIAEIEKGTPLLSIVEWTTALRSQVGRIGLEFHYTDHAIASIAGTGAWAAGFHLPIYSGAQSGPRAVRTREQIRFWAKSLHSQGMRLSVHGFQEEEFVAQARELGADVVTGDDIWSFRSTGCSRTPTSIAAPQRELCVAA